MGKNDVFWDENGGNFDDIELTQIELGLILVYVDFQHVSLGYHESFITTLEA